MDKQISESDADIVARVNSERFSVDDLQNIADAIHALPEGDRDFVGRSMALLKLFPGRPMRMFAADVRMMAFAEIIKQEVLPQGVLPKAADGSRAVAECVFEAAATEPLLRRDDSFVFHAESFSRRVLELADADGKA